MVQVKVYSIVWNIDSSGCYFFFFYDCTHTNRLYFSPVIADLSLESFDHLIVIVDFVVLIISATGDVGGAVKENIN